MDPKLFRNRIDPDHWKEVGPFNQNRKQFGKKMGIILGKEELGKKCLKLTLIESLCVGNHPASAGKITGYAGQASHKVHCLQHMYLYCWWCAAIWLHCHISAILPRCNIIALEAAISTHAVSEIYPLLSSSLTFTSAVCDPVCVPQANVQVLSSSVLVVQVCTSGAVQALSISPVHGVQAGKL